MTDTKKPQLWIVLRQNLPNHKKDFKGEQTKYGLNVTKIAEDVGVTEKSVFEWLMNNQVSGRRVKQLIALDGSTLTITLLEPFLTSA